MARTPAAVVLMLALLAAALPAAASAAPPAAPPATAGAFIVTLADGVDPQGVAAEYARRGEARVVHVYEHALTGFAGSMSEAGLSRLRGDQRVVRVERDGVATASATQLSAPWGLDRTDQRALPLSGSYSDDAATGAGVTAYIIDTGIDPHDDFSGRLSSTGFTAIDDGQGVGDCDGHGTHVAGTVGGETYGIAKDVTLVSVRVLDCSGSGTWSGVIEGIDFVTEQHAAGALSVANMSLGGGANSSVDDAVRRSVTDGVTYVVAAGNNGKDACSYSPARTAEAVTVGATDRTDTRASWSNFGSCLDLFAPGVSITSAAHDSQTGTLTISGTSMASPHVAGVAALYLQANGSTAPADVAAALVADGTTGVVSSAGRWSPNVLLHSRYAAATTEPTEPVDASPTASFTSSCPDLTCTFTNTSTDDGAITSAWTFGDGGTSAADAPSYTYAAAGTYTVTLTVTDAAGQSDSHSAPVTVTAAQTGGITLTAVGYKVKGAKSVDLTWDGATSTSVDVFRDGARVATSTDDDGAHTDAIGGKGGGSYTYRVCEAGTTTCSPDVTVTF